MPEVNFTDRVGTEVEKVADKVTVLKLYDEVPRIFSEEVIVRLPYSYYGATDCPGSTSPYAYQQWKINSIYDPDLTGGGGNFQPLGRDTWAGIYNYYKVLKTKIRVQTYDTSIAATDTANQSRFASLHGGMINLTASPPPNQHLWIMNSHAGASNLQNVFSPVIMYNPVASRGPAYIEYEMEWDPTLLQSALLDQSSKDTWTPVGSDPDALEYFSQICWNPNPASVGARTIVWKIDIEFMVSFKQVNATLYSTIN